MTKNPCSDAGGPGSAPGQGTRFCMPQLNIPYIAMKINDSVCHS